MQNGQINDPDNVNGDELLNEINSFRCQISSFLDSNKFIEDLYPAGKTYS